MRTRKEFMAAFKQVCEAGKFIPRIGHNTCIELKDEKGLRLFCPLTAVAKDLTGKTYHMSDFQKAGKELGLRRNTINEIANAADIYPNCKQIVRKELLACL